jgi:hypothetical protein
MATVKTRADAVRPYMVITSHNAVTTLRFKTQTKDFAFQTFRCAVASWRETGLCFSIRLFGLDLWQNVCFLT